MIMYTIVSFVLLILSLSIIFMASITTSGNNMKTSIITFVLLVVVSLIYAFVLPPFDEWTAKRYDEAIKNAKIAREKYNPEIACKNDWTNYCLVVNTKKLNNAIEDSISAFRDYCTFNAK
ncbi:MAG: hypothetical protein MJZ25_09105 [Fibrobacter sp.]|nr:hypothetical protein [Fibrobacter sp.]